jgi:hypothetical protein
MRALALLVLIVPLLGFSCGGSVSFFSGTPGFGGGGTGQSSGPIPTPVPIVIQRGPPLTAEDVAEPVDLGDFDTEAPEPIDVGPMPTPTPTPPPHAGGSTI